MGEAGKISRVLSPMFGSMITFASLEESGGTASGQMTAGQMKRIWEALEP
jgi:3-dehydroquinate dehydratase-1